MLTAKANTLCLLKILYEFSDEDNILTMAEIQEKMDMLYGLKIDRRTVASSLVILEEMGYEISKFEDNGSGYYLLKREFEPSEIRFLMDSVYSNTALPTSTSEKLIAKIQLLMPYHKRKYYRHLSVITTTKKTLNKEVFYNIDVLDAAISNKKKVSFIYTEYDVHKKLIPRRETKYVLSPYALVSANDAYYLICGSDRWKDVTQYRIDKIKDIEELDEAIMPPPKDFDVSKYTDESAFMYGGEYVNAMLKCDNKILGNVIDKFGQNVRLSDNGDGTFDANIKGSFEGIKLFACLFMDTCEVAEPKNLRNSVVQIIKNNKYGI